MITVLEYIKNFKKQRGLYIIKPKDAELLKIICNKLNYKYQSNVAYVGKAELTKNSDLYKRSKQEMGWANFDSATFVRKIGTYLGYDIKDKKNKIIKNLTKEFICNNFTIECISLNLSENILEKEKEFIKKYKPCMNIKNNLL